MDCLLIYTIDIDNIAVVFDPRNRTCPKTNIKQVFNNTPSVSQSPTLSTLLWRTYTRELSEVFTVDNLFPNYNFNFNNRMFVVSTMEWWPFIIKERRGNKTTYSGICYDLLKELSTSLNFSFQLIEPPDQEWGIMKDGRWTGLIGQLARSEVDLVVAAITVSNARETVMDFSFPYFYDSTGIFLRKPDAGLQKWYTLLAPFTWQVLLCICGVLVFTSVFLYLIERLNPYYERKNQMRKRFQLDSALWYLLGALLAHGGVQVPPTLASRVIIGCWWLFCIVSTATYSGNLIAFLTVTKDKLPFETLEGMLQQDTYKWGIMGGSVAETLFQNSSIDTYQHIWRKLLEFYRYDPDVLDPSQTSHLQKVLQGDYAVITDRSVLAAWSKYACNISLLPEKFFPNHYALGLPNNSPYLDMFTSQMIQIYESGLLQIWKQRWWPKTSYCAGSLQTHADAVDLLSLQSAFYIIAIGLFLALCVLVCEVIRVRYKCCIGGIH
ncbi:glutamate receptor ionotropic, kainate 3 [Patella vulgata]|uniref:glutamate receptor ionotropic, kainate 3 n=1 Tax=Patella vulgata TaxID=6465 RepID=UPI0021805DA7|nr:glutamate receptor ionotropic, kainate 3 [Patella vulgata]